MGGENCEIEVLESRERKGGMRQIALGAFVVVTEVLSSLPCSFELLYVCPLVRRQRQMCVKDRHKHFGKPPGVSRFCRSRRSRAHPSSLPGSYQHIPGLESAHAIVHFLLLQ